MTLDKVDYFQISEILESGQVFRFNKISKDNYILIAQQRIIQIVQDNQTVTFHHATEEDLKDIWIGYFDLKRDYSRITSQLTQKDEHMKKAVEFGKGIRILRQDPWEMLISFIISQNKAIPHIKQCISNLCRIFGEKLGDIEPYGAYYSFPSPECLASATEEALRNCKVGFRAPYILDAARRITEGKVDLDELYSLSADEAKEKLMTIKGVGPKIADCILLFAYGKGEVFPTDVWIKRVIEGIYFNGKDIKIGEIQKFARDYFGELAGYAQQYLFFYGRENQLFK